MGLSDVGQGDVLRNEWPGIILELLIIIRFVLFDQIRRWHNDRPKSLAVLAQRSTCLSGRRPCRDRVVGDLSSPSDRMLARFFTGLHPLLFLSLATYQPKLTPSQSIVADRHVMAHNIILPISVAKPSNCCCQSYKKISNDLDTNARLGRGGNQGSIGHLVFRRVPQQQSVPFTRHRQCPPGSPNLLSAEF